MALYEKEICEKLRLPSIPKKEHDGKSPFKNCVAVVNTVMGDEVYAVASFDPEKDAKPRIVKVFGGDRITDIVRVFIVPEYMSVDDIKDADLDDESKKRAKELADEAEEIENEGVDKGVKEPENEYYFPHIKNDDEARAYIEAYNKSNRIRARVPRTHEGLIMRLSVIYAETNKK